MNIAEYMAWLFQKPEVRGQISEVGRQISEARGLKTEVRSEDLSSVLCPLPSVIRHLSTVLYYLFSFICHLSSVFCHLFSVPINLAQYLRGHIITQFHRFISMFGSQIIRPFFQIGDGQVIVGRRKVCIELKCL